MIHTTERNSRPTDNRFIRELKGGLTITNAMLEDDGQWQCEAENAMGYVKNAKPLQIVVLGKRLRIIKLFKLCSIYLSYRPS